MSNRHQLFDLPTQPKQFPSNLDTSVTLYRDNDSGTWRLFLCPSAECVDFSLAQLRELTAKLNTVIAE